jgi:hypothetical protein
VLKDCASPAVVRQRLIPSRAAGFSHGVRYARGSALGVGEAASLLNPPSHGPGPAARWVLLCPV